MTPDQRERAELLWRRGNSALTIARCLTGVDYREIEAEFDMTKYIPPSKPRFTDGFMDWLWNECPYTWRKGTNENPPDAPWSRVPGHRKYSTDG